MFGRRSTAEEGRAVDEQIEFGRLATALEHLKRQPKPTAHAEAQIRQLTTKMESATALMAHMDDDLKWGKPKGKESAMLLWHNHDGHRHFFKSHLVLDAPPVDVLVRAPERSARPRRSSRAPAWPTTAPLLHRSRAPIPSVRTLHRSGHSP
jgi:hypothetical protein